MHVRVDVDCEFVFKNEFVAVRGLSLWAHTLVCCCRGTLTPDNSRSSPDALKDGQKEHSPGQFAGIVSD